MAVAAIVNAVWDLWAKREGKPVWKLLADLPPEEVVALVDFTYLTDALTPDEALDAARERRRRAGRARADAAASAASRPTRPRRAGSATTTRSCAG